MSDWVTAFWVEPFQAPVREAEIVPFPAAAPPVVEPACRLAAACRQDRLERMLAAAALNSREGRASLRWLVASCERCGRCKSMPPPI
jgi:hypothetical protein